MKKYGLLKIESRVSLVLSVLGKVNAKVGIYVDVPGGNNLGSVVS